MTRNENCNVAGTCGLVEANIRGSRLKSDASGELTFNLPETESTKFANLFETLEKAKATMGILNFGLSVTTMEDVFLK